MPRSPSACVLIAPSYERKFIGFFSVNLKCAGMREYNECLARGLIPADQLTRSATWTLLG